MPDLEFLAKFAEKTGTNPWELFVLRLEASNEGQVRAMAERVRGEPESLFEVARRAVMRRAVEDAAATTFAAEPAVVQVPIYEARASAGPGAFADRDSILGHVALDEGWLHASLGLAASRLIAVRAWGNSMEPTIFSNDLMLLEHPVERPMDGAIYVVVRGGAILVKRLRVLAPRRYKLEGDNPAAPVEIIEPDDPEEPRLIGRVRMTLRQL